MFCLKLKIFLLYFLDIKMYNMERGYKQNNNYFLTKKVSASNIITNIKLEYFLEIYLKPTFFK